MAPVDTVATLPEETADVQRPAPSLVSAIAIAWSAESPERVGEVALLGSAPRILGRGGSSHEDPFPRLAFVRERGGAVHPTEPLASPHVSRIQLHVRALDDGAMQIENVGRLRLSVRGADVTSVTLGVGDTFELGAQFLFLVVRRAPSARARVEAGFSFGEPDAHGMVGESTAAWLLRDAIAFVAAHDGHVLVHGATGTGKELVARALHASGNRASGPFVARNAATIPETLIDAELFGHARNFPNAGMPERPGLIGEADGGTLFLDEFAELPAPMQAHLLRVLDDGEYQRLGETRPRRSTFRFVAATNRPVASIKHDVLARLVHRVHVPPFEERREDIPLFVAHVLRRIAARDQDIARRWLDPSGHARVSLSMIRALLQPGGATNMRAIEAILWRSVAAGRGERLELAGDDGGAFDAALPLADPSDIGVGPQPSRVQACLDENNGQLEATWRALGLPSRHALARLIKKHGLEVRRRPR